MLISFKQKQSWIFQLFCWNPLVSQNMYASCLNVLSKKIYETKQSKWDLCKFLILVDNSTSCWYWKYETRWLCNAVWLEDSISFLNEKNSLAPRKWWKIGLVLTFLSLFAASSFCHAYTYQAHEEWVGRTA